MLNRSQSTFSWVLTDFQSIGVSRHLANYQPAVDQVSTDCQLSFSWYVNQVLIKGIDQHLTVAAFSTPNPRLLQ